MLRNPINYRFLKLQDYKSTLDVMKDFTNSRQQGTIDEIWFLEHPAVFTVGKAGLMEHVLNPGKVNIIQTDRGGQVTYHAPGQLIVYFLIDLIRSSLTVKNLIYLLQQSIIDLLWYYFGINANLNIKAPGVYVAGKKICSIGLKVTKGRSYHGLSFNVNMDLTPFKHINPCGYPGLEITQLKDLINHEISVDMVAQLFKELLKLRFTN